MTVDVDDGEDFTVEPDHPRGRCDGCGGQLGYGVDRGGCVCDGPWGEPDWVIA